MITGINDKSPTLSREAFVQIKSGGVLLSQGVYPQVPSALTGLTAVFGMGTGVSPSLRPPEIYCQLRRTHHLTFVSQGYENAMRVRVSRTPEQARA